MENIVRRLVKSQRSGAASADALFIGEGKPLGEDGDLSGIFKARVRAIDVGVQGVAGDEQVDRRYHGGPDRALHQYPAEHYARLADAFPALREDFVPGCLGENVSSSGLCEQDVFVGDVVRLGAGVGLEAEAQPLQGRFLLVVGRDLGAEIGGAPQRTAATYGSCTASARYGGGGRLCPAGTTRLRKPRA